MKNVKMSRKKEQKRNYLHVTKALGRLDLWKMQVSDPEILQHIEEIRREVAKIK